MKAIVQDRYGGPEVLALQDVEVPGIRADEVLVRVHAASVHPDIWHVMRGQPYVIRAAAPRRPRHRIPGIDLAGVVEAAGRDVTRFRRGDEVFGETIRGLQWRNGGAFAEYASAPEATLAPKPAGLSFEQAAVVPTSGMIALQAVRRDGNVQAGQRVLVNGAGGGVGLFAVQLAKAFGAEVTGVDAPAKLDLVRSFADHVVDYTREDFTQSRYDVIVDIPGNRSIADCLRALTPGGTYVIIGHDGYGAAGSPWLGTMPRTLLLVAMSPFVRGLPTPDFSAPRKAEELTVLKEFVETGKLTPVIDRTFPLAEVPDAIRYLETGAVAGKVAIALT
jgi:NADPH:quinone reductase-like Zn-dependent oxidoreductase